MSARAWRLWAASRILQVEVWLLRLAERIAGEPFAELYAGSDGIWGPVTLERHARLRDAGHDLRVLVGGVDVTPRCRFFDDRPGQRRAELYDLDADGRKHIDPATRTFAVIDVDAFEVVER